MENQYQYDPLGSHEDIRLLVLEAGQTDEPLRGNVIQVPIRDKKFPYEAISYAWGSPDQRSKIITPRGYLAITASLDRVLHRLRQPKSHRVVWADAICINQGDKEEKAVQVPLMRDIYEGATQTLICLTEPFPSTLHSLLNDWSTNLKLGLAWFSLMRLRSRPPSWTEVKAVNLALHQSWFRRMWTVQELVVSRNPTVVSDSFQWPWDKFSEIGNAVNTFEIHRQLVSFWYGKIVIILFLIGLEHFDSEGRWATFTRSNSISSFLTNAFWFLFLAVFVHQFHLLISSFFLGAQSRFEHRVLQDLDELRRNPRGQLLDRLRMLQRSPRDCYFTRDHLFAVLGMIFDDEAQCELIRPDYAEPIEQVILRYARMLQEQGHTLELFHRASSVPLSPRFPSWVPDWTKPFEEPLHRHTLRNLDHLPNLSRIGKIMLKIGTALRMDLLVSDSAVDESRWVRMVSRARPNSTPPTPNAEPPPDTLALTGNFAGTISSLSDFPEWYSFRSDVGSRRVEMGHMSSILNYAIIPSTAYFLYHPPPEYTKGTWPRMAACFSAMLTSEAALLNPFQASIYPSKALQPGSLRLSRLLAHAGGCCLAALDFVVYLLTWVRPIRWELSRIFDKFPGYQDAFWRLWSRFGTEKEWQVLSLSNIRLGVFNSKPCLVFSDTVEIGDKVFYFDGSRIPFVLRPSKDRPGFYRLFGECYTEDFTAGVTAEFETKKRVIWLH